jgi:hypothetical protein
MNQMRVILSEAKALLHPTLVLGLLLCARAAGSQQIEASAQTFAVQSHVRFSSSKMEQTGQWVGVDGAVRFGSVRVGFLTSMGSLSGSGSPLHPDSKGRLTSIAVHGYAMPWLAVGANIEAKRFETDAGSTVWRLIGLNVRATPQLDAHALEGLLDVSYWPVASVVYGEKIPLAMRAVVGATYRFGSSPLGVRFAYRFERFDFEAQGTTPARLEQFRGATLGAVLRFSR